MDLWKVRIFVTVVRSGGIYPAADELGRTPSAISVALTKFENEVGGELFESARKTRLTRFGEVIYEDASRLIEHYDTFTGTIGKDRGRAGRATFAMLDSIASVFLPAMIRRISEDSPELEIVARVLDSGAIQDLVGRGIVEIGVAGHQWAVHDIEYRVLFREKLNLVCSHTDDIAKLPEPVPLSAIANRSIIRSGIKDELIDKICRGTGNTSPLHVRSINAIVKLVEYGQHVTIMPSILRGVTEDRRVCFKTIADENASRSVYVLTRANRKISPSAQRFVAAMLSTMASHADLFLDPLPASARCSSATSPAP